MTQTMMFQALSDETRLRALLLMAEARELCVCELVEALDVSQPKISRHMGVLRDAGLVGSRRQAQWVFYFINPRLAPWQSRIIEAVIEGRRDSDVARADLRRLDAMSDRPRPCPA
ncbi:MAG: transcriptional regulator [Hyphomicrobiales bacterium]|nr:MAG: transcriptional regulator [Hyphomicrobiales bacterium]